MCGILSKYVSRPCSQCPEGASKCLASELKMECPVLQGPSRGFWVWVLGFGCWVLLVHQTWRIGDARLSSPCLTSHPRKRTNQLRWNPGQKHLLDLGHPDAACCCLLLTACSDNKIGCWASCLLLAAQTQHNLSEPPGPRP